MKKSIFLCLILVRALAFAQDANPFLKFTPQYVKSAIDQKQSSMAIVPAGNADIKLIPEFPLFTMMRLGLSLNGVAMSAESRTELAEKLGQQKIPEILNKLNNEGLLKEAIRLGQIYNLDPLHILGPIIGENSFNGFIDRTIQDSYHKMFQSSDIQKMSEKMAAIVNTAGGQECLQSDIANYWKWRCIVFYSARASNNSNADLINGFYNITGKNTGSFGLGQIQPFLLWSLNDIVVEKAKYEKFQVVNLEKPMRIIFNNKEMLAYIAANAVASIQIYKMMAGVDISQNPGLTTTLYNVGDEYRRAYMMNEQRTKINPQALPQVNYMGWYINHFASQIRTVLQKAK